MALPTAVVLTCAGCGSVQETEASADTSSIDFSDTDDETPSTGARDDDGSDGGRGLNLDVGAPDGSSGGSGADPSGDEECATQTLESYEEQGPVDIILVVDTSPSMTEALLAVENNINGNFADILEHAGIEYRVIVLGDYPPTENLHTICISAPLSDTDCNPPPTAPAMNDRYKHYDGYTGSGDLFDNILAWYGEPTAHAPMGYQGWLREGTLKVFLVITDGTSATSNTAIGDAFDADLLGLAAEQFGTAEDRDYVLHAILEMPSNNPVTEPWLPGDPLNGEGLSIQHVAAMTGGWRFPLAQTELFDVVFSEVANGVIERTTISCTIPIPKPDAAQTIDPDTIEIDVVSSDGSMVASLHQVVGPQACVPDAFHVAGGAIELCPDACEGVQADIGAHIDIRYGCDVGFDPAG